MSPILTQLAYSAGRQSHGILEMILRGELPKPPNFIVLNGDPGMENSQSYEFVDSARQRCRMAGIPFETVRSSLYHDLMTFKQRGLTRLDLPPFWTRDRETGKLGKLQQGCTRFYKIAAIRRSLRLHMFRYHGVGLESRRPKPVTCWIGFAADEQNRADACESDVRYIRHEYPLIQLGLTKQMLRDYYRERGIPEPPPSVCNACYSNGLAFLEAMYLDRPDDWEQAVAVDEAIRDLRQLGVRDECFVSSTLIPLKDLPGLNFLKGQSELRRKHGCNSGACFL